MKATVTTYKTTGKWYDTFDVGIPDDTPCYDTWAVQKAVLAASGMNPAEFYYTIRIDDPRPGFWFHRLFTPE
jgi:hypothetical protein